MSAPTPHETILGILAAKPQHGYQILNHFNHPENLGRVWSVSTSQVYAVLKRLEGEGALVGEQVSGEDAPDRTVYSLTPRGEERLKAWLKDPKPSPSIRRVRIDFISRLYVARLLALSPAEMIHNQLFACQQERRRRLDTHPAAGEDTLEPIIEDFILGQLDAAIVWLSRLSEIDLSQHQGAKTDVES